MTKIDFYNEDGLVPVSIPFDIYNSLIDMIDEYAIYLSKNFGIRKYFDKPTGLDCSNAWINLDKEKFYRRLKAQVGQALSDNFDQNLYASGDSDVSIIVFANISEFICNELYDADYLGIDETGRKYYYFEENASRDKQLEFIETLNQILERNSLPFKLDDEGHFKRKIDGEFQKNLESTTSEVDSRLSELIDYSRQLILSVDPQQRKIAAKEIAAAFQRVKSLYASQQSEVKESTQKLIRNVSAGNNEFENFVDSISKQINTISNGAEIRHAEIYQSPLITDEQIDYFFQITLLTIKLLVAGYKADSD